MDQSLIFWPMVAHFALVIIVYLELGRRRFLAGKARLITYRDYEILGRSVEPDNCARAARNIVNNFELPMLFHAAILALYLTNAVSYPQLALAWLFIASRYLHSVIHLTYNKVTHRALSFFVGVFALTAMWIAFAVTLYSGSF